MLLSRLRGAAHCVFSSTKKCAIARPTVGVSWAAKRRYSLRTVAVGISAISALLAISRDAPFLSVIATAIALNMLAANAIRSYRLVAPSGRMIGFNLMRCSLWLLFAASLMCMYLLASVPAITLLEYIPCRDDTRLALTHAVFEPVLWLNRLYGCERWNATVMYVAFWRNAWESWLCVTMAGSIMCFIVYARYLWNRLVPDAFATPYAASRATTPTSLP